MGPPSVSHLNGKLIVPNRIIGVVAEINVGHDIHGDYSSLGMAALVGCC